jgi:hypothetical protein
VSKPIRLHQSTAKDILKCPALAYLRHPELGGVEGEDTDAMRDGRLLEDLICGVPPEEFVVMDFKNWQTKAAREAKKNCPGTAILRHKYDAAAEAASIIRSRINHRLHDNGLPPLDDYLQQPHLEWTCPDTGVLCAGTPDLLWLRDDSFLILDLKKMADVSIGGIRKSVFNFGLDIQQAAYMEAIETLHPDIAGRGRFVFVGYDLAEPNFVSLFRLNGEFRQLGRSRWDQAKRIWKRCLEHGQWDDYTAGGIAEIDPKPWMMANEETDW